MSYEYRVVPFFAVSKSGSSMQQRRAQAAEQFQNLLTAHQSEGFEYMRMDHYHLTEPPGCLGAFMGAAPTIVSYDVAVFRRAYGR
jgi:hypothetical protein